MPEALVGLGSNLAPELNLPAAVRLLGERLDVRRVSSAWATPPVGPGGQPPFLNAAALVRSELPPEGLKTHLRAIEGELGRVRSTDRFAPRTIDLDIVIYDIGSRDASGLQILDPDLHRETHLAVPAAELLPDWIHPATGESLARLADRLLASLGGSRVPRRAPVRLGD